MVDSASPPALPARVETEPYVPIAGMAVAAAVTAGIFLLILLVLAIDAFAVRKRPPIMGELLLLPVVTIVLAFAGRRIVLTSEGTRTGMVLGVDLNAAAWWSAVVGGLVYIAYLLAIDYSIGREAEAESRRFIEFILQDDIPRAFDRTLPPGSRLGADETKIKQRRGDEYYAFRQSDLVRLVERNKKECTFVPGGLREWAYRPKGIECNYVGKLLCPEGVFPVSITLKSTDTVAGSEAAGRQWEVQFYPGGYISREGISRTAFGWAILEMERRGRSVGRDFLSTLNRSPAMQPYVYAGFVNPGTQPREWQSVGLTTQGRLAVGGGLCGAGGSIPGYAVALAGDFLRSPGGGELAPLQREQFRTIWTTIGVLQAGSRLRTMTEASETISLSDKQVEVRVPMELPLSDESVARGWVVVACTAPDVIKELLTLRSAATPDAAATSASESFRKLDIPWRVVSLESDLRPVSTRRGPPGGEGE